MSSIVCQGLQSCLEPRLIEPRVLRHKLGPNSSSQSLPWPQRPSVLRHQQEHQENSHNEEEKSNKNNNNGDLGGWSFIQALTGTSHNCKEVTEKEKVYVHPLVKLSSSTLSNKSLEMCTESLGSETGSDISERSDEITSLSLKSENTHLTERSKAEKFSKKLTSSASFPPPLTSISGSDNVRVRPCREGGRLVLKAVTVAPSSTFFQTERVNGRLRLCLLNCDSYEVVEGVDATKAGGEYYDGDGDGDGDDDDGEVDGDEDDDDDEWVEGIGGNSGNVGCEIEIGEFPRPSRCKEGGGSGNKGMSSLGPFWVAIS
ncbi:unnamed protein product [Camellia sinensis]